MSAEGVKQFIAALDLLFPAPQFGGSIERQRAWAKTYTVALCNTDDDLLAAARDRFIRTRDPREPRQAFFPSVAECLEVVRDVAEERDRRPTLPLDKPKPQDVPYHARVQLARDLMQSPMGQSARNDGWASVMFHFCVEHMRVPAGPEVDQCKHEAREFNRIQAELPGSHPLGRPLARLAETMVRKARERMGGKAA